MNEVLRYIVSVKAVVQRIETAGKNWEVVGQEPLEPNSTALKNVYGYTPPIEKTVQREVAVYEQTVESLDLPKLVSVVNGIGAP